ncbi:MAG: hypothetical protein ACREJ5_23300 [Geminicoccaceae bacterium]
MNADLLAFDGGWQIRTVIARGRFMVEDGELGRGWRTGSRTANRVEDGEPVVRDMFDRIILEQHA